MPKARSTEDPEHGLALKILENDELAAAFVDAFALHRSLAHPAFAQAHRLGIDAQGRRYGVMEWCRGEPLAPGWLQGRGDGPTIARLILSGLDHLHRMGLAHGDLAPDNVLVETGPAAGVKILDLGAAGALGSAVGSVSGVLTHLSPERLAGGGLSVTADLFAVGVLLHGAIHGEHPYPNYPRTMPTGPPKIGGAGTDALDPWLSRLLHPNPDARYPNGAAALDALAEMAPGSSEIPSLAPPSLPFVDVGGVFEAIKGKIRPALERGQSLALNVGGARGRGRSRLLEEVTNLLGALGVRAVSERVLPTDGPGDLLIRLSRTVGSESGQGAPGNVLGLARGLLRHARSLDSPLALVIDDAERADLITTRGLSYLSESVGDVPLEVAPVLVVMTATEADPGLGIWTTADLLTLLESIYPGRRMARKDASALLERWGGRIAELAPQLERMARTGAFLVTSTGLAIDKDWLSAGAGQDDEDARLEALSAPELELLGRLAYARGPIPRPMADGPIDALITHGCVVPVQALHGPSVAVASEGWQVSGRRIMEAQDAYEAWLLAWGARDGEDAASERLWMGLQSAPNDHREEARRFVVESTPDHGARLVALVTDKGWPSAGEAVVAGDAARAALEDDLALELYGRAAAAGDVRGALRLAAMHTSASRHAEALEVLEQVEDDGDDFGAELACARARSAVLTGRLEEAAAYIEIGRSSEVEEVVRARLGNTAGLIAFYRGELAEAERELEAALAAARGADDRREQAAIVTALGLIDFRRGALGRARDRYEEALVMGEEEGDQARVLTSLQNLAVVHHEEGAYREALDTYSQALALAESLEQTGRIVQLSGNLGNLYRYLGDLPAALRVIERGLSLAREEENHYMTGLLLVLLGDVYLAEENWERALAALTEAVEVTVSSESATEEVDARIGLTRLHLEVRDYRAAAEEAERALAAAKGSELRGHEAQALALLAAAHGESIHGDGPLADRSMRDALARMEEVTSPDVQWKIWLDGMRHAQRRGETDHAHDRGRQVRRLLQQLEDGVPAAYRQGFGACRDRRRAWAETLPGHGAEVRGSSGLGDETWRRLLEINKRLTTEHDVKRLLEYIMDSAVLLSGAERGFLLLVRDDSGELDVRVARNLDRENIQRTKMKISHSIASRVIEGGEAVVTLDAMEDERYREQLSVHDLKLRSVICLPMIRGGEVLGAIYLDNRFRASAFGEGVLSTMEAFADQAAIALANARLVASMAETQAELQTAHENVARLNASLESELEVRTQALEDSHKVVIRQREQLTGQHRYERLIGQADSLKRIFHAMDRLLDNTIPVLLEGESGTGKELVARAIHFNGARASGPFVAINCGAIPHALLESELFGHVQGSFTGATRDKIGVFEAADGGTLLLDELGELPLDMQTALLRVLQSGEYKRVGETIERTVDVRVIAATNKTLLDEVAAKRFREDLYYRLAAVPLTLPPLRERRGDVALLVDHFLEVHHKMGLSAVTAIDKGALSLLQGYDWPGNVRQLEMVLKSACLFADESVLTVEDFSSFPDISGEGGRSLKGARLSGRSLADIERDAIIQALHDHGGNKKRSAEQLGIDRRTLYNKLKTYKITVERELRVR